MLKSQKGSTFVICVKGAHAVMTKHLSTEWDFAKVLSAGSLSSDALLLIFTKWVAFK